MKKIALFILMMLPVAVSGQQTHMPDYSITIERSIGALEIEKDLKFNTIVRLKSSKPHNSGVILTVYKIKGKKRKKVYKKFFPNSYLYLTHDENSSIAVAQGKSITQAYFWKEKVDGKDFWQGWIKEYGFDL